MNLNFCGNVPTIGKLLYAHLTSDCFLNGAQYKVGFASKLKIKDKLITMSNLEPVSFAIFYVDFMFILEVGLLNLALAHFAARVASIYCRSTSNVGVFSIEGQSRVKRGEKVKPHSRLNVGNFVFWGFYTATQPQLALLLHVAAVCKYS